MANMKRWIGMVVFNSCMLLHPVMAKKVALVIGNANYQSQDVLPNTLNDAADMAALLEKQLGFSPVRLVNNVSLNQFETELKQFKEEAKDATEVVFYFSGHGMRGGGHGNADESYILPVDAQISQNHHIARQGIGVQYVVDELRQKGRTAIIIVDACRNNPFKIAGRSAKTRGLSLPDLNRGDGGVIIAYSASLGQVAEERTGERNGLYTGQLLKQLPLQQKLRDVFIETSEAVIKASREKQAESLRVGQRVNEDLVQHPYTESNGLSQKIYLAGEPPSLEEQLWQKALDKKSAAIFTIYQQDYCPQGAHCKEVTGYIQDYTPVAPITPVTPPVTPLPKLIAAIEKEMVAIPAGEFMMGDDNSEYDKEKPAHRVKVPAFKMLAHEVTWAMYQPCIDAGKCPDNKKEGGDEGWGKGQRPVINVSWNDITQHYLPWLNSLSDQQYRLPSEAEWEYAARAGSTSKYSWGDTIQCSQAQYGGGWDGSCKNSNKTVAVKSYQPNAFGLYDMHGNVWEWTLDCWHRNYDDAPEDGTAWLADNKGECDKHVLRGGSWVSSPDSLRSAVRGRNYATNRDYELSGFRLVQDTP